MKARNPVAGLDRPCDVMLPSHLAFRNPHCWEEKRVLKMFANSKLDQTPFDM